MDLPEPLASQLLDAPLIATIATLNRDGSVHLVAVWFLREGSTLLIPTNGQSRKARNLRRDPAATVMVHDSPGGLDVRGLTLLGQGDIVELPEARALNDRVHAKYVHRTGLELPAVHEFLEGDDVTIRFAIERASHWDETSTLAARELGASGAFVQTGLS